MRNTHYSIAILTNTDGYPLTELIGYATAHGCTCEAVRFPVTPLSDLATSALLETLKRYDVVYYRTGMRDTILPELTRLLAEHNIPVINAGTKHPFLHKKVQQAIVAGRYGIPQPKSLYQAAFNYPLIAEALGPTFVVKPDSGSQGNEVGLIHSAEELAAFQSKSTKNRHLYQEYIADADEYRVYTIGESGVAVYKKALGDNDFRANLHVGGSMLPAEVEHQATLLAFGGQVATAFGAEIAGVDVLLRNGEPLFLELNWQPGWQQLEELTGCNFVHATMQFILDRAAESKTNTAIGR